jgi:hypothetical protein
MPFVMADENILLLSYFLSGNRPDDRKVAIVRFDWPLLHLSGPPNDEAIRGHPSWRRGLESYRVYRVEQSSLLRRLAAMNYVHPRNDPAAYDQDHHCIFTFHDSTFECIAQSYSFTIEQAPSGSERYERMVEMVRTRDNRWHSEFRATGKPPFRVRLRWLVNALNPWSR